ncbi:MAG: tRNA 2-thiocytidine biosynthesis protein TtcA [Clostridiales bacterium]|nr:tRNA 2-thiocytidine biosynthesis protein TtcA [Clostridiales bacterium]
MPDIMKELLAPVRAAVQRYDMIQEGDHIAVGVSGGKDSLILLAALQGLRRFYPRPFTLTAITLDLCTDGAETDYQPLTQWCASMDIPHMIRRTRLWEIIFRERKEANPCSLCARMRRGILHREAVAAGCCTVALGHHQNDAAETLLMNLLEGGSLSCFSPKAYLSNRGLWMIRPLIFLPEAQIAAAARQLHLPVIPSSCPADGHTRRQDIKELLAHLSGEYGPLDAKMVSALQKAELSGW